MNGYSESKAEERIIKTNILRLDTGSVSFELDERIMEILDKYARKHPKVLSEDESTTYMVQNIYVNLREILSQALLVYETKTRFMICVERDKHDNCLKYKEVERESIDIWTPHVVIHISPDDVKVESIHDCACGD